MKVSVNVNIGKKLKCSDLLGGEVFCRFCNLEDVLTNKHDELVYIALEYWTDEPDGHSSYSAFDPVTGELLRVCDNEDVYVFKNARLNIGG